MTSIVPPTSFKFFNLCFEPTYFLCLFRKAIILIS